MSFCIYKDQVKCLASVTERGRGVRLSLRSIWDILTAPGSQISLLCLFQPGLNGSVESFNAGYEMKRKEGEWLEGVGRAAGISRPPESPQPGSLPIMGASVVGRRDRYHSQARGGRVGVSPAPIGRPHLCKQVPGLKRPKYFQPTQPGLLLAGEPLLGAAPVVGAVRAGLQGEL